jgi:hypothetical protein
MKPGMKVKIEGVPETLRVLRKIDPDLRREVPDQIKSYAQPMLQEIKAGFPVEMLSGWSSKGRTGYRPGSARWKTTLQFKGSKPRNSPSNSWPLVRVRSKHLAVIIADTANKSKTRQGAAMVTRLQQKHGKNSRFIWPVVEKHQKDIERGIEKAFERYAKRVTKELGR